MRQPSIGRLIALLTGATVVLLLTIDTTMACRLLARHRYCSPCPPVTRCRVVAPAPCNPPAASNCCGETEVYGLPTEQYMELADPAPAVPTPALVPDVGEVDAAQALEDAPADSIEPAVLPSEVQAIPTDLPAPDDLDSPEDDLFDEPTIVEEPADDLFDEPADLPEADVPADDLPPNDFQSEPSDDDLFDAPAADDAAANDLFDEPAGDMPADDLDILDAPADTPPPGDDLFDTPADDAAPADDLFDAPTVDQPAPLDGDMDLPGFEDAPPADEPADAVPADDSDDSLDDLFGSTSGASDTEPRTAAAGEPNTGDSLERLDDAAPADDLFDSVPVEDGDDNAVDDLDDLFGARQTPSRVETPQTTKPVAEQIDELPVRQWTDNTGRFQTIGRLVRVTPTHIQLLKDNGRFSTVSKRRLSEADLAYVEEVTQQLGVEYFDQVASR